MKLFIYTIIAIVAAAIIAGFFVVGSPQQERLRRFDDQRVSDLQAIQGQIIYYWQNKERLPGNLENLQDPISGFVPGKDPETQESYTYETKSDLEFILCANFNLSGISGERPGVPAVPMMYPYPGVNVSNWDHNAGKYCFERKIDPELYKLLNPAR